ncbi:MAG: pyridoxal phosphate-dependent aminotransferase [Bdellovibrionota bacterium]
MNVRLAERVRRIQPSATLSIDAKAKQLKAEGKDVVGFGAGEPDFDTPDHIKEAAIAAIKAGQTKYTAVGGTPELRKAVCTRIKGDYGLDYQPNEVLVSCGGKHTLYNLFLAMLDKGDEVIIPAPYWVSYPEMVGMADATPVCVETKEEDGFALTPQALEKVLTPRTRMVVLNYPSNPTGATMSEAQIRAVAKVLEKHPDVWVISDDIYLRLLYEGAKFFSIATISQQWKERTIIVNGASKAYSMTGWRIGWAAGNKDVIAAMEKLQSQSTSNPSSIAQAAALAAFTGDQHVVDKMLVAFDERRKVIVDLLNSIDGIKCRLPEGAFYVFPNVKGVLGKSFNGKKIASDMDFAAYLLEQALVAVVPGTPFGAPGYMRLSYATSMDNIRKGLSRIKEAVGKLG